MSSICEGGWRYPMKMLAFGVTFLRLADIVSTFGVLKPTFPSSAPVSSALQAFQGRRNSAGRAMFMVEDVGPRGAYELVTKGDFTYIDVRAENEFSHGHPANSINIPAFRPTAMGMQRNPDFVDEVAQQFPERNSKLVIGCQMGARSAQAALWLEDAGYKTVFNVAGGYGEWARDESLPVDV